MKNKKKQKNIKRMILIFQEEIVKEMDYVKRMN